MELVNQLVTNPYTLGRNVWYRAISRTNVDIPKSVFEPAVAVFE